MAGVLWMVFVVFCPLVLSESGDDDWFEKEVTCTSTLTLKQSKLTCSLNDEPIEEPICSKINYRNFSISKDRLGGDGVYYTRVRAQPVDYFNGDWSEWSSTANFTIKENSTEPLMVPSLSSLYITIGFSVFLVLIILGALLWRTHIKGCITPNIPHPKATLAQMHRAREGLPFTFSPEIFSDVFIHRVDYVDEKPSDPELEDSLDECCYSQTSSSNASVSEMDMNAEERLPKEQSHLKIRLLDESDLSKGRENSGFHGVTAPQRECKDEAYVTMSSLFKTQ
ncbi:Interleukin-7 receptor subunit alpha [Anabarilius grahami]|uniref:Interleukin-7 receptor subunit alpha n=1 Tax=Anabarilius grahami TaxID=495550 RepID=A0A3N0YNX4_ANAGA|nr:Interleukin-7 receptor subunit alpha [Anabarilius grahami]